jgi:hypothetical protein
LPFVRIGVIAAVLIIGGIVAAVRDSSPNQRYFNKLVEMDQKMESQISGGGATSFRSRVEALPISGVTDPDLLELHQILKQIGNPPESALNSPDWVTNTLGKFRKLVDKANNKYAH